MHIHPDPLKSYAEWSAELLLKYTLEELNLAFLFFPPAGLILTISKPEKQDNAALNRVIKAL